MHRTRVKICGITRPQDALAAAQAGADAIGMVLYANSKRLITIAQAARIVRALPPYVTPVGMFVNCPLNEIRAIAKAVGLFVVQFHGDESPAAATALKPLVVIKAIGVDRLPQWSRESTPLLLDSPIGGSGVENNWAAIAHHRKLLAGRPWIAAGGLTPDNVAAVMRKLRPWAVDVSSGVESRPGIKSPRLIGQFIQAVRQADARRRG